jgi:hypothetical protein
VVGYARLRLCRLVDWLVMQIMVGSIWLCRIVVKLVIQDCGYAGWLVGYADYGRKYLVVKDCGQIWK